MNDINKPNISLVREYMELQEVEDTMFSDLRRRVSKEPQYVKDILESEIANTLILIEDKMSVIFNETELHVQIASLKICPSLAEKGKLMASALQDVMYTMADNIETLLASEREERRAGI